MISLTTRYVNVVGVVGKGWDNLLGCTDTAAVGAVVGREHSPGEAVEEVAGIQGTVGTPEAQEHIPHRGHKWASVGKERTVLEPVVEVAPGTVGEQLEEEQLEAEL